MDRESEGEWSRWKGNEVKTKDKEVMIQENIVRGVE
jgi:hypothetical protein